MKDEAVGTRCAATVEDQRPEGLLFRVFYSLEMEPTPAGKLDLRTGQFELRAGSAKDAWHGAFSWITRDLEASRKALEFTLTVTELPEVVEDKVEVEEGCRTSWVVPCHASLPVLMALSPRASWLLVGMAIVLVWSVVGGIVYRCQMGVTEFDEDVSDWLLTRGDRAAETEEPAEPVKATGWQPVSRKEGGTP